MSSSSLTPPALPPTLVEGDVIVPSGARFGIVASRFNAFIVDRLVDGALDALQRHGAARESTTLVRVPGAWEMPVAIARLARSRRIDAVIALGAVIRGSTPHFDYVAGEIAKGAAHIQLETGVPVLFGVLTTDTIEQAIERAGTKAGNKGYDAATAAIEMVNVVSAMARAGL